MAKKTPRGPIPSREDKNKKAAIELAERFLRETRRGDENSYKAIEPKKAAQLQIKSVASRELSDLTKKQASKTIRKVARQERYTEKTLSDLYAKISQFQSELDKATELNDRNQITDSNRQIELLHQKIATFEFYQQQIQEIYYAVSAELLKNPLDISNKTVRYYVDHINIITNNIDNESLDILSNEEKNTLHNLANKVGERLKSRINTFKTLGRGIKRVIGSDVVQGLVDTAAADAPFLKLAVGTARRVFGKRKNASFLLNRQSIREKQRTLSVKLHNQHVPHEVAQNSKTPQAAEMTDLETPETTASRITKNRDESDCCGETVKILNEHTELLKKLYSTDEKQLKLYDKTIQNQVTADEEYNLEHQNEPIPTSTATKVEQKSDSNGLLGTLSDILKNGLAGAIGGSLGAIIAGVAGRLLGVAGLAILATGAIYLFDKWVSDHFPKLREGVKSENGSDAFGAASAANITNAVNSARASVWQYKNLPPKTVVSPQNTPRTGNILNLEPPPTRVGQLKLPFDAVPAAEQSASRITAFKSNFSPSFKGQFQNQIKGFTSSTKLAKFNRVAAIAGTGYDFANRKINGQTTSQAAIGATSSTVGGILAGMLASSATGAAVGTFVGGPVGTVLGGLAGFAAGAVAGYYGSVYAGSLADMLTGANTLNDTTSPAIPTGMEGVTFNDLSKEQQERLLDEQQRQEGFFPGSRSHRNNNPGNIKFGEFALKHGAIGNDGKFAVFPTLEVGKNAQRALWNLIPTVEENPNKLRYSQMPLTQALQIWARPDHPGYINNILKATQIPTTAKGKDINLPTLQPTQSTPTAQLNGDTVATGRVETVGSLLQRATENPEINLNYFAGSSPKIVAAQKQNYPQTLIGKVADPMLFDFPFTRHIIGTPS